MATHRRRIWRVLMTGKTGMHRTTLVKKKNLDHFCRTLFKECFTHCFVCHLNSYLTKLDFTKFPLRIKELEQVEFKIRWAPRHQKNTSLGPLGNVELLDLWRLGRSNGVGIFFLKGRHVEIGSTKMFLGGVIFPAMLNKHPKMRTEGSNMINWNKNMGIQMIYHHIIMYLFRFTSIQILSRCSLRNCPSMSWRINPCWW